MKPTEAMKPLLEFIETVPTVYMTTIDREGYPSTRAMLNLRAAKSYPSFAALYEQEENPLTVYITTHKSSEKMAELRGNPKGSLHFSKPNIYRGATFTGHFEVVEDVEFRRKLWQDGWLLYYPEGAESEDYVVLKFSPVKVKSYNAYKVDTLVL